MAHPERYIAAAVLVIGALMAAWSVLCERRHLPAAPDNTPGRDPELLWECRHIHNQPTTSRKEDTP
jgi:hypothetical protein